MNAFTKAFAFAHELDFSLQILNYIEPATSRIKAFIRPSMAFGKKQYPAETQQLFELILCPKYVNVIHATY